MRRPSTTIRNTRKHFVRCVDCNTQTLPQNASKEKPWTTAVALRIPGRVNDGALCFDCGNKRRALLALPVEDQQSEPLKVESASPVPNGRIEAARKRVRINKQEHTLEVSTLDSLLAKWNDYRCYDEYKHREMDLKKWVVIVNERQISPDEFNSLPVSDGDEISIMSGCLLHPF